MGDDVNHPEAAVLMCQQPYGASWEPDYRLPHMGVQPKFLDFPQQNHDILNDGYFYRIAVFSCAANERCLDMGKLDRYKQENRLAPLTFTLVQNAICHAQEQGTGD